MKSPSGKFIPPIRMLMSNPMAFLVTSLVLVFAFTSTILLISHVDPLSAYHQIFLGSLSSWSRIGHVFKAWIPLTLCAVGLLYTFRINLWNIGVEGQMIMGGICSMIVLRWYPESAHPGWKSPDGSMRSNCQKRSASDQKRP